MRLSFRLRFPLALAGALLALTLNPPSAIHSDREVSAQGAPARPEVLWPEHSDQMPIGLEHIPPALPPQVLDHRELPRKTLPGRIGSSGRSGPDPVLQLSSPGNAATTGVGFEGINNINFVLPPDTNGDLGPNHYVQIVNLSFAIWDRLGNLLYGPANNNTLWTGFGGACETSNDGDPVVLYDHLADRWLISQFALPRFPAGPFFICIAVSQTPSPLGTWSRYAYSFRKLPDYLKFGVWPDGYYMAVNQFNAGSLFWGGQGVVAFERDKMLAGQTARGVYFDLYSVNRVLGGMLPSHLTGPAPASGTPNTFIEIDDDAWGYSPDQLWLWDFRVNWTNTSLSTFTQAAELPTAAFDTNLCNYSRNCIPQPGGTPLDSLSDRLMYRLNYRNFGSYHSLVSAHSVDIDGQDHAGVRWFELRRSGGSWTIYQQSTYAAPDTDHRWMPSAAINRNGAIALGYSVSSVTTYPSIRATGRTLHDRPGMMTQGEVSIMEGGDFQRHSSGRWGDYASMSVDPVDGCTFWFTSEYYRAGTTTSAGWRTFIGSLKLSDCR